MAIQLVTTSGVLTIPGAYNTIQALQTVTGLSATGVVAIIGEADGGADFSSETSVPVFGPDQVATVKAKYISGPIVDAMGILANPVSDPQITGVLSSAVIVKTNKSNKASGTLLNSVGGTYGTLYDQNFGVPGNRISYQVSAATTEAPATSGAFTFIGPTRAATANLRLNGGTILPLAITAEMTPVAFVAAANALTGVSATGGADRVVNTGGSIAGQNITFVVTGNTAVITASTGAWAVTPTAGDTLYIGSASTLVTVGPQASNEGMYVVTSATTTTINVTKVADKSGGTPGTVSAPVSQTSQANAVASFTCYSPVTITNNSNAGVVIDGAGKTLEIAEGSVRGATTEASANCFLVVGSTSSLAAIVSTTTVPLIISSTSEYSVTLADSRATDSVQESVTAGGEVALLIGYKGTTASVTISTVSNILQISSAVAGGVGAAFATVALAGYTTIGDLIAYINAQPGWTAAAGSGILGQLPPSALDQGTYTCGTQFGSTAARIKIDGYRLFQKISQNLILVQFGNPALDSANGLPAVMASPKMLAGGTRGGSTQSVVGAAFTYLEGVKGINFVVPLFSVNASTDIANGITDSSSSYLIDSVNALAKAHVTKMSGLKVRQNRQAVISKDDTFAVVCASAANIAYYRCNFVFQQVKALSAVTSAITQFPAWGAACFAAGGQSAAFYQSIMGKDLVISGAVQAAGDFNDQSISQMETALLQGLMPIAKQDDGGYQFVSDQTTYGKDSSFLYNSLQAVYASDTVALTVSKRMEKAFKGRSTADVTASLAKAFMESVLAEMLRVKLISASDDAPRGFKSLVVKIAGNSILCSLEIKLTGTIYFIKTDFLVSQVIQSA